MAPTRDPHIAWLLRLRWGALAGQVATIAFVRLGMEVPLPLAWLAVLVAAGALSNLLCAARMRRGGVFGEALIAAVMALDIVLLTGLLYLTGGPSNPFSFLYLVHIALASVLLPARLTWSLVGLSLVCSAALFVHSRPLEMSHGEFMDSHLRGMWVAFGIAAAFIVYFLLRVTRALAHREAELAAAHRLASLATLAAGAAHELATPLGTIAVAARELERRSHDAGSADDVRVIRAQVERCRAILEQMSADAGAGAGEGFGPVPVADLLSIATNGLPARPAVRVEADARTRSSRMVVPHRAVGRAIRGVLENAQQASSEDGEVHLRASFADGALELEVRDAGQGMSPEILARAGEPFFTTKPVGRGMGLGLFLTRAVLEDLGGRLLLESEPGRGTIARMRLPARSPATIRRIVGAA